MSGGRAVFSAARRCAAGAALALVVAASAPSSSRAATAADSIRFRTLVTNGNRVALNVTNYGFFGTNFIGPDPSFQFPSGSGFEHMARAGLWVGASAATDTGGYTLRVSTGVVDNNQGSAQLQDTEFTPAGDKIVERSRILNSPVYSPAALSDEDLLCSYSDNPGRGPRGEQREAHIPLNILVEQSTFGFALPAAQDFVVLRFRVVNQGPPLINVYLGLYVQLVSGDRSRYGTWPPSAANGPGSWYYNTYADYDTTRRLYREHFCRSLPYPGGCDFAYTPPWAALKLLKVSPDSVAAKTVSFNWWTFTPGDPSRDQDEERYALMSNGARGDLSSCTPGTQSCSPIAVLSVGPFEQVDPGREVIVDFALIGGDDESRLTANADYAQYAADIDYLLPKDPPSPRLQVTTGARRVDLTWDDSPEFAEDETSPAPDHRDFEGYRVYLGLDRQNPTLVAQFDKNEAPHDTTGFNTGFGTIQRDTLINGELRHTYHYSITGLRDGLSYYGAVTSYDLGDATVSSLESGLNQNKFQAVPMPAPREDTRGPIVFPNPYRVEAQWDRGTLVRDHYLWFARLPRRCMLRIYNLAGDLVFETRFEGGSYTGQGTRGLYDPSQDLDTGPPALSGASFAWNLITTRGQAIATGLYIFSVEDLESGHVSRGKFLVVKSDREQ